MRKSDTVFTCCHWRLECSFCTIFFKGVWYYCSKGFTTTRSRDLPWSHVRFMDSSWTRPSTNMSQELVGMRLPLTFFGIRFYPLYLFHLKQEGRSAVSSDIVSWVNFLHSRDVKRVWTKMQRKVLIDVLVEDVPMIRSVFHIQSISRATWYGK